MFHSRRLLQHIPLPILAVFLPSLSERCGRRLPPPDRGGSAFNCVQLPSSGFRSGAARSSWFSLSTSLSAPFPNQCSDEYKNRNSENDRQECGPKNTNALSWSISGAKEEQTRSCVFNKLQMPAFSTPFESYSYKSRGRGFSLLAKNLRPRLAKTVDCTPPSLSASFGGCGVHPHA
jgi:hypothetical protein